MCRRGGAPETYKCEYERTLYLVQCEATRKPPTSTLHEFKAHLVAARLGTVPSTEGDAANTTPMGQNSIYIHSLHLIFLSIKSTYYMLHRRSLRDAANGHDAWKSECTTLRHLCGLVLAHLYLVGLISFSVSRNCARLHGCNDFVEVNQHSRKGYPD